MHDKLSCKHKNCHANIGKTKSRSAKKGNQVHTNLRQYTVISVSYTHLDVYKRQVIDGANDFTIFSRIIMPLSKPVVAVMILYYGVGQWNSWFPAAMFTRDRKIYPLQMILREILIENQAQNADSLIAAVEDTFSSELVKYCTIIAVSYTHL